MLSELQRKDVWENWLGAEIRSYYFADLVSHYSTQQKALTWTILLLSSGAAGTAFSSFHWLVAGLSIVTAGLSGFSLVQQNQKATTECADLQFRWSRLGNKFKALWNDMYADDAGARLEVLEEKVDEVSKSSSAIRTDQKRMTKWQDHVERHHGYKK